MNLQHAIASAAVALGVAFSPVVAQAAPTYSAIYAFGDSLSDAGNLAAVTGAPAAPYYQGEFSNGPNWVQDLAAGLGLAPLAPSLLGGTDYAWGGATTANTATASAFVPNLTQQVGLFASSLTAAAPSTALYTVWIGANDLFGILGGNPCLSSSSAAMACTLGAAKSEADAITFLASTGATNFLVPLLPDLGKTPGILANGPIASATATALSSAYNSALMADLAGLAGTSGIRLSFLDTFSLLDDAVADPAAFGLSNVTDPCYVGPYTGGGTECSNPNQYLFWDQVHPTAAGAALVAQAALRALPEPGTLAIVAVGLVGLAATRRRRAVVATAC